MSYKPINFYELESVQKFTNKSINPNYNAHKISVPFRSCVIGSSGSGKSNLIMNLISVMAGTFNHIYIFTQAEEPLYEYLESKIPDTMLTIRYGIEALEAFPHENFYGQSLVIVDDIIEQGTLHYSTTATNTTTYNGDYIQYEFPFLIEISKLSVYGLFSASVEYLPKEMVLLGSSDNETTWDYIMTLDRVNATTSGTVMTLTKTHTTTSKYDIFRLVITKGTDSAPDGNGPIDRNIFITNIQLFGDIYTQ